MRTKLIGTIVMVIALIGVSAFAGPWITGRVDYNSYQTPSQTISLDIGFTIPFITPGLSFDLYTGFLIKGDGPYEVVGKKLGGDIIYKGSSGYIKLGMYNCGIDRDHFYVEWHYEYELPWTLVPAKTQTGSSG